MRRRFDQQTIDADRDSSAVEAAVPWIDLGLLLVPLVAAIVVLIRVAGTFHAIGDQANEEMFVRDIGHHAVLVGPYSRDNWNHLGPAMFYVLALPYRLFGSNSAALWIGALIVHALALTAIALLAKRHGGTSLMVLMIFGCAVVIRALGADFIRNPWNPYLPVFAFGALLFLVWAMACGDAWAMPVAAAVATFCVQTHVGYVPLAAPLFGIGAVWLTWIAVKQRAGGGVRAPSIRSLAKAAAVTVGVLAVMWLPPLLEEVTHSPGNLTKVFHYFRHPPAGARHSFLQGARIVFAQFWVAPEWVRGPAQPNPFSGESALLYKAPIPVLLIAFALGCFALWRRRASTLGGDERGWRLAAIIGAALLLGVISIARTTGPAFDYRTRWTLVLAMTALMVSAWAGWTLVAPHLTVRSRRAALLLTVLPIAIVAGTATADAARAGTPQSPISTSIQTLGTASLAALPPGGGDVVVHSPDVLTGSISGLVLWLERNGVRARVEPEDGLAMGSHRIHKNGGVRAVLTIATDTNVDDYANREDQRLVAATPDFHAAARRRVMDEIAAVNHAYDEHRLTKSALFDRVGELSRELGHVTAIFIQASA